MRAEHNAEKFVIISDGHLLQSYMGAYDPILDFEKVFQKITKLSPDFILIGGDMFDKRKTETSDVRHPEGEAAMMKIREIFDNTKIPIYAIHCNLMKSAMLVIYSRNSLSKCVLLHWWSLVIYLSKMQHKMLI